MTSGPGDSFYDTPDVLARYRAHRARTSTSPNHVMEEPAVLSEVGDPRGLRVLDLGCGDAGFGRQLLAAGAASYLGIDSSRRMVALADRTLAGTLGTVRSGDLEQLAPVEGEYDLVTARLALHYVVGLPALLRTVAGALAPGGRFVMTVVHPVITCHHTPSEGQRTSWLVDDYFRSGSRQHTWLGQQVTWQHRTVEDYVGEVVKAGFSLAALRECAPVPDRCAGDTAELERRRRVPLFLLLSCHLADADGPAAT